MAQYTHHKIQRKRKRKRKELKNLHYTLLLASMALIISISVVLFFLFQKCPSPMVNKLICICVSGYFGSIEAIHNKEENKSNYSH